MTRSQAQVGRLLVIALVLGAVCASGNGSQPSANAAAGDPTDSTVTVRGRDAFANLEITISQTSNLINQVIRISWTGGAPTQPSTLSYGINYLQIMQCWGGDPAAPHAPAILPARTGA